MTEVKHMIYFLLHSQVPYQEIASETAQTQLVHAWDSSVGTTFNTLYCSTDPYITILRQKGRLDIIENISFEQRYNSFQIHLQTLVDRSNPGHCMVHIYSSSSNKSDYAVGPEWANGKIRFLKGKQSRLVWSGSHSLRT